MTENEHSKGGSERFEVVIDGPEEGMEKEHAVILRRGLVIDGFHDHAVHVRPVDRHTDHSEEIND